MSPSPELLSPNTIHYNNDVHFTLGFKELLFLAFTLFIGFCGFTVCVEQIYSEEDIHQIESITVHHKSLTERNLTTNRNLTIASN